MVLQENENWSPINNPTTESNSSFQENKSLNVETDCSKKKCTTSDDKTSESDTSDAPEQKRSKMSRTTDWESVEVPWKKLDSQTLLNFSKNWAGLDKKKRDSAITRAVYYVVDHVREITDHAPTAAFRALARKMCSKYSDVFEDKLSDGSREGTGCATLENKLIERNRYLNRPHRTKSLQGTLKLPLKDAKKYKAYQSGCIQWQPNLNEGHDESTTEALRRVFFNFDPVEVLEENRFAECVSNFAACYPLHRMHLNQKERPTAVTIKELWPCLFTYEYADIHFQLLTGRQTDNFMNQFQQHAYKILENGAL